MTTQNPGMSIQNWTKKSDVTMKKSDIPGDAIAVPYVTKLTRQKCYVVFVAIVQYVPRNSIFYMHLSSILNCFRERIA